MKKPVADPDPKKRKEQRKNVLRELDRNPDNRVALELKAELDALDGAEAQPVKPKRKGEYVWQSDGRDSHGSYRGERFATITKTDNTNSPKD